MLVATTTQNILHFSQKDNIVWPSWRAKILFFDILWKRPLSAPEIHKEILDFSRKSQGFPSQYSKLHFGKGNSQISNTASLCGCSDLMYSEILAKTIWFVCISFQLVFPISACRVNTGREHDICHIASVNSRLIT